MTRARRMTKEERKAALAEAATLYVERIATWANNLNIRYRGYTEADLEKICSEEAKDSLHYVGWNQILFLESILGLNYYQKANGYQKLDQRFSPLKRRIKTLAKEQLGFD